MANWEVKAYNFGHYAVPGRESWIEVLTITNVISGKLTLTLNDTSKLTLTVQTSWYSFIKPVKTLLEVKHVDDRKFFGNVTKVTKDVVNGTTKVEAVGVLGSLQFLPNYREYADSVDLNGIIECESKRYLGEYQSGDPEYVASPWIDLYTPKGEGKIPSDFGKLSMSSYPSMHTTCNLDKVKRNAKNSYDFLKTITKENNYCLPTELQNPTWFKWVEYGEQAEFKPISGVNTQTISYKVNLMSGSLAISPYKSRVRKYFNIGSGVQDSYELTGTEYPIPYYYDSSTLPNKDDGSPYITAEVQKAVQHDLDERSTLIEATAFDAHLIDNTIPWLDMGKYVNVVYYDSSEQTAQAQITQIEYDLVDSSKDRVKLGRIVSSITDSLSASASDVAKQIEEYLPLSGGTMQGDIAFKDASSVVNDSKVTIHDRIFGTCNLIGELEQGGIDFNNGSDQAITTRLRSGFTSIKASTTYTLKFSTTNSLRIRAIVYYNANKGWVSTSQYGTNATEATFTTPSGVSYLRVVLQNTSSGTVVPSEVYNFQLEKGSTASPYAPYAMDNVELTKLVSPTTDTYYHSTQVARTTSLDDSGTYLNLKRGWYTIMAEAVANNASIHSIALANVYSGTSYELLDYKQSQSISGLSQSRLSASWSGYLDFDATTVKVYVRYNGTGSNQVFIRAKKLV